MRSYEEIFVRNLQFPAIQIQLLCVTYDNAIFLLGSNLYNQSAVVLYACSFTLYHNNYCVTYLLIFS